MKKDIKISLQIASCYTFLMTLLSDERIFWLITVASSAPVSTSRNL